MFTARCAAVSLSLLSAAIAFADTPIAASRPAGTQPASLIASSRPAKPGNVPPLPAPTGKVTHVRTTDELLAALRAAREGETILLADGLYDVAGRGFLTLARDRMSLRGASGDPTRVVLKGKGFRVHDRNEEMIKVAGRGITIADLTVRDVGANGIKLHTGANHDLLVHNVHFIDICERAIKGPRVEVSRNGVVRYCTFEQVTPITRDIPDLEARGNYIAGMDMMCIDGWRIHDNVFRNIRGRTGQGRAGVFIWVGSSNCTVERNTFLGCDRAIAFGNPTGDNAMTGGVIRNNFIEAGVSHAIEICHADGVKVDHNSIHHLTPRRADPTFLLLDSRNVEIRNNIAFSRSMGLSGDDFVAANNLWLSDPALVSRFFANAASGDLHLTAAAEAIDKAAKLPEVTDDWDGQKRPAKPDIGADERSELP